MQLPVSVWVRRLVLCVALLGAAAFAAAPAPRPTLPNFDGWHKVKSTLEAKPGWGLASADVAVMQELGLSWIERDTYQFNGRTIEVQGYRFGDAGGAYGAFTYFRPSDFHAFDLGQPHDEAASGNTAILFTRGDWLIRAQMDQLTAMTASQMRQLAVNLTSTAGFDQLPTLPYYLPRKGLVPESLRFVRGPAGFAAACNWVAANTLGFDFSAQAVLANYDFGLETNGQSSTAQLVIIAYPTPQLARTYLARLQKDSGFELRRTGPMLVLVHANPGAEAQAAALLTQVNWDAVITMVPPTPAGLGALPALILGIFVLCALIMGVAIVVGLLTGVLRVWAERWLPQRFRRASHPALIRLGLTLPGQEKFGAHGGTPT